jgi:indolepyruvate ferredoxin oxidoreductase alpha subunit
VVGGALIVVGEDYGEGASVIQERTHAFAMKSTLALFDPRPDLAVMVRPGRARLRAQRGQQHAGGDGAAHPRLPCARQLRGQATTCAPRFSTRALIDEPAGFDYMPSWRTRR